VQRGITNEGISKRCTPLLLARLPSGFDPSSINPITFTLVPHNLYSSTTRYPFPLSIPSMHSLYNFYPSTLYLDAHHCQTDWHVSNTAHIKYGTYQIRYPSLKHTASYLISCSWYRLISSSSDPSYGVFFRPITVKHTASYLRSASLSFQIRHVARPRARKRHRRPHPVCCKQTGRCRAQSLCSHNKRQQPQHVCKSSIAYDAFHS